MVATLVDRSTALSARRFAESAIESSCGVKAILRRHGASRREPPAQRVLPRWHREAGASELRDRQRTVAWTRCLRLHLVHRHADEIRLQISNEDRDLLGHVIPACVARVHAM